MIATLSELLFAAVEETSLALFALLEVCAKGHHVVLTRPMWDRSAPIGTWLARLPRRARLEVEELFREGIDASAQAPAAAKRIHVDAVAACRWEAPAPTLDVATALHVLRAPLRVLVEDRFSDGAFVSKMVTPDRQARFREALARGWIEMDHGGGIGTMRKRVEAVAADPSARARMWVLSDSDARQRGDVSRAAELLGEACATTPGAWAVPYHRLGRRSIENYLPGEALGSGAHLHLDREKRHDYGRRVNAYRQLSEEQRHHYNMKSGLLGDVATEEKRKAYRAGGHEIADEDLPQLFRSLSRTAKEDLRHGFGENVAELYVDDGGVPFVTEAALQRESGAERARLVRSLFESL